MNTHGDVVAASYEQLFSGGGVEVPVLYDEHGEEYWDYVWTGTRADGTLSDAHCGGWSQTNFDHVGTIGLSGLAGSDWTDLWWPDNPYHCATVFPVYCVEQ